HFASSSSSHFFYTDTATTESYTLSLHDALPILLASRLGRSDKIPLAQRLLMRVAGGSYERHLNRALQRPGRVLSISVLLLIGSLDRKSTRLNSSHVKISYAVFCLKKKKR